MDKDYLRLNSESRLSDESVNEYSVKVAVKKKKSSEENSTLQIIFDEIYNKGNSIGVSGANTNKPKLLDSIIFSSIILLFGVILAVITYFTRELFLLQLLVISSAIIVPISLLYFFYRLDVKGKVKFSTIMYLVVAGVVIFIVTELVFEKIINQTNQSYHSFVAIRCLIELLLVSLVCYLIYGGMRTKSVTTPLLIACAVAVGFAFSKSLSQNFSLLLINVNVAPSGETVGAIVNVENFIKDSVKSVIESFATVSVYRPFVFIALCVIIVRILTSQVPSVGKKTANSFFTFLFCSVTYILSSLQTPFNVLTFFYNLISIVFTGYLFINAINSCVKDEKYE
jgi:hypothetical protein